VKYLFVLSLIAIAAFAVYWRLRPFIRGVRRFLGVVREVNRMSATRPQTNIPRESARTRAPSEKLVRCAACGTWIPAASAVALRATGATYCSHACLERAADSPRRARKSAS
jgi:hypothetical protein